MRRACLGLAELIGISFPSVYYWLDGRTTPEKESREKLAVFFGAGRLLIKKGSTFLSERRTATQTPAEDSIFRWRQRRRKETRETSLKKARNHKKVEDA